MERLIKLTCETDSCSSKGTPVEMVTEATQYMCGACGQFITNAEEVIDGNTEETK
jgi:predicted RNA-binding Zn-ribbon protein involved in translation (DUF1610 family)